MRLEADPPATNGNTGTVSNDTVVFEGPAGFGVEICSLISGRGAAIRLELRPRGNTDARGDARGGFEEDDETGVENGSLTGCRGAAIGLEPPKAVADVDAMG